MREETFVRWYDARFGQVSRWAGGLILCGFTLLLGVQGALTQPQAREYLSYVYRAEGTALAPLPSATAEMFCLTLTLMDHEPSPAVRLLINGRVAADFRANPVTVEVFFGDVLSVDASPPTKSLRLVLGSLPAAIYSGALPPEIIFPQGSGTIGAILPPPPAP